MHISKRNQKEYNMILAAERVFGKVGFSNAKMEDIAEEAGITKVTLYSYFQSKENLYLGVTYYILQQLNDRFYQAIEENKENKGIDGIIAIVNTFMEHCENNFLAAQSLLDYYSILRKSAVDKEGLQLTDATKESIYFKKLEGIQNIAFKLAAKEIKRGQEDGSIDPTLNSVVNTMYLWSAIVGYVKLVSATGDDISPVFNISMVDLKKVCISSMRRHLTAHL